MRARARRCRQLLGEAERSNVALRTEYAERDVAWRKWVRELTGAHPAQTFMALDDELRALVTAEVVRLRSRLWSADLRVSELTQALADKRHVTRHRVMALRDEIGMYIDTGHADFTAIDAAFSRTLDDPGTGISEEMAQSDRPAGLNPHAERPSR